MIKIGKKQFEDSDDFNDWLSDSMADFLFNIRDYKIYTETDSIGSFPLHEYEEGIEFYYTNKGMKLVERWKKRMKKIYDYYFDDNNFNPTCGMYIEG